MHTPVIEHLETRAKETASSEFIVWKDGQCLIEWPDARKLNIYSITKSLVSLAFGIAFDQGKLSNFDTSISQYFPELKGTGKEAITIRHLLSHTSGIADPSGHQNDWEVMMEAPDLVKYVLSKAQAFAPGERCYYSNRATSILPTVLEHITGVAFLDFVRKYLFDPMGIHDFVWKQDKVGHCFGSSEVEMSAKDLLKIGIMVLNRGLWEGKRIVSEKWLNLSGQNSSRLHPRMGLLWWKLPHAWASFDDPNFVVYWDKSLLEEYKKAGLPQDMLDWIARHLDEEFTPAAMRKKLGHDLLKVFVGDFSMKAFDAMIPIYRVKAFAEYGVEAHGWFGQYLVIMPDKNLVAVRLCDDEGKDYDPKYFFSDLVEILRRL